MGNKGGKSRVPKEAKQDKPVVDPRKEAEKRHEPGGTNFEEYPKRMRMTEE
jgi:hypothetical protein